MPHDHQVAFKLVFPHFRQIVVVDMEVNDGRNTVLQVRFCNVIAAVSARSYHQCPVAGPVLFAAKPHLHPCCRVLEFSYFADGSDNI